MAVGFTKIKDFKGVNFTDPATEVGDDEFVTARNCFAYHKGEVGPRQVQRVVEKRFTPGTGLFDQESRIEWLPWETGADDAAFGCGIFQFIDSNQVHRILAYLPFAWPAAGSGLVGPVQYDPMAAFLHTSQAGFYFPNGDETVVWKPGSTFDNASGRYFSRLNGVPSRPVSLVHNNELYLFLGHSYAGLVLGAQDFGQPANVAPKFRELGTSWVTGAGTSGDRFKFAFGDVYRGVFVMGGLSSPYESALAVTEPGDTPGVLVHPSKWPGVGFGDGDRLLRVKTTPIIGGASAVEPYMLAFKQRSVWLIQGYTPSSTDEGDLSMTPIMRREGLIAPHAVCETPYGLVWCSGQNVWLMPPGTEPKAIGNKIKGLLKTLPQQPSDAWFMEYHDDVLYLNFPSPQAIRRGTEYNQGEALAYLRTYPMSQQLWCDLRDFEEKEEVRWWGPQDVRCAHMLSLNFPAGPKQLAGLTPYWRGDTTYVVQPFTMADEGIDLQVSATGATKSFGFDLADPGNYLEWTVTTAMKGDVVPNSVTQVLRSREMPFGDDALEKIIERVIVNAHWTAGLNRTEKPVAWLATDLPLMLGWLANGGRKRNVAAGSTPEAEDFLETSPQSVGFVLDESTLDSATYLAEAFIPLPFFPAGGSRFLARTLQLALFSCMVRDQFPIVTWDALRDAVDSYMVRKFRVRSLEVTVRPIGRRPGGSYGG